MDSHDAYLIIDLSPYFNRGSDKLQARNFALFSFTCAF